MIEAWLEKAVSVIWNYPVVGLCLVTGLFFTVRMAFIQIRCFTHALALLTGKYDNDQEPGELTHFQALSAALSGTVGLGNIAGVAIAIAMGGPGAIFWMWVAAFLGMATKYAECGLATIYREKCPITGRYAGGPMMYITKGLGPKWKPLALFFAACTSIGAFGFADMFQANQVAAAMTRYYSVPDWITGIILALLVALTIVGGIKRIGTVAEKIVPLMCFLYMFAAMFICFTNIDLIPQAFSIIFSDAFTGNAAAGGVIGTVIITGVRRAIFSNEAGLGSAPMAHSTVKTNHPIREGIVASLEPFFDTIIVCTATAIVIVVTGRFGAEAYEEIPIAHVTQADPSEYIMGGGWEIASEGIPVPKEQLRSYLEGDTVLAFLAATTSVDTAEGEEEPAGSAITPQFALTAKSKKAILQKNLKDQGIKRADGIRFSSFYEGTGRSVELLDSTGATLGRFDLNGTPQILYKKNSATGNDEPYLSITAEGIPGDWSTQVITFGPAYLKQLEIGTPGVESVSLRFMSTAETKRWVVDRIQTVKQLSGIELTSVAFDKNLGSWGGLLLTIAVFFFCYSTMITWSYYGEITAKFIFGETIVLPYKIAFIFCAFLGCIINLPIVLNFSDLMCGLMVIPNTIAILLLSPVVIRETKEYFIKLHRGDFKTDPKKASTNDLLNDSD
jgi:AGCS family alanine or glycine:cation symporter